MPLDKKALDKTDWQILTLLQENARLSYAEIGRRVGLSLPAAAERIRRMEEAEIIEGYYAKIKPEAIGLNISAFIRAFVPAEKYPQFTSLVSSLSEVLECHHVTGEEAFVLKIAVTSIPHLEQVVAQLSQYGQTSASIVMSSPITRRTITEFQLMRIAN